jgi:hypothetical protein
MSATAEEPSCLVPGAVLAPDLLPSGWIDVQSLRMAWITDSIDVLRAPQGLIERPPVAHLRYEPSDQTSQ